LFITHSILLQEFCLLGFLDPGSLDTELKAGTKLDLPFWLSSCLRNEQLTEIKWPKCYLPRFRSALIADAQVVNLAATPYFYELGAKLGLLQKDSDLLKVLQESFNERYKLILDNSKNMYNSDVSSFTKKLSFSEQRLFKLSYNSGVEFANWKNGNSEKICTSAILPKKTQQKIAFSKKRKELPNPEDHS